MNFANRLYPSSLVNILKSQAYLQLATDLYTHTDKEKRDTAMMARFRDYINMAISEATINVDKTKNEPNAYILRAASYEMAMVYDADTYYPLAQADYKKAIQLDPNNPDIILSLSKLEYARGSREESAGLIDRSLSLKRNYVQAYYTLADILEGENQREKKAYVLQEALKANPQNQNIAYYLAQEYYKLGLYDDYQKLMSDLITLNPDLKVLKEQLDKNMQSVPAKTTK